MFTEPTVLILGAGASCHLGYPTGEALIKKIISTSANGEKEFANQLIKMQPLSIDMFLSYHRRWISVGKSAITSVLLESESPHAFERSEKRRRNPEGGWHAPHGNWYRFLLDSIISQCESSELILENLKNLNIVTFNYDLSLEYYLYSRLTEIDFFNKEHIQSFLNNLNIIHVYGQLGCFEWHKDHFSNIYKKDPFIRSQNDYGQFKYSNDGFYKSNLISNCSKGIEIIGNNKWNPENRPKHIDIIRDSIEEAKNIVILGFGFYEENMNLIRLDEELFDDMSFQNIFYTNYGDHQKIDRQILKRTRRWAMPDQCIKSTKSVYNALSQDFDLLG